MKYYVVEIVTANEATAKQVTEKEAGRDAFMLLHQVMASSMSNNAVTEALCMVINNTGTVLKSDYYVVPTEVEE